MAISSRAAAICSIRDVVNLQPVDLSVAQSETGRRRQIAGVTRQDVAAASAQQPRGQLEPLIFLSPADQRQFAGRALGRLRYIQAVRLEIRRFGGGHDGSLPK